MNRIRLTESQLHRVIKESVNKVLNELGPTYSSNYNSIKNRNFDWDENTIINKLCNEVRKLGLNPNGIINNKELIISWMLNNNDLGVGIPELSEIGMDCGSDTFDDRVVSLLNKMQSKVMAHKPWR